MSAAHIRKPAKVEAAGVGRKIIEEFVGRVNTGTGDVSIARMKSPSGWSEPPQKPEFDEYTLVLAGSLRVKTEEGEIDVGATELFVAGRGTEVQYSTPGPEGAEYISVCLPAFSPETVHRKE